VVILLDSSELLVVSDEFSDVDKKCFHSAFGSCQGY